MALTLRSLVERTGAVLPPFLEPSMFLSQISIGKRLTLVLGLILALFFASSVVAVVKLSQLGREIDAMVHDNIKTERAGSDWLRHTTSGV